MRNKAKIFLLSSLAALLVVPLLGCGFIGKLTHPSALSREQAIAIILVAGTPYIDDYIVNGHPEETLPNLVSVSIKYIEGESVVLMLDDENFAVSTRSACAAGALQASHVLLSIGRDFADAQGTLVITFGVDNVEEDVTRFLPALKEAVATLREISPLYAKKAAQA